MGGAWRIALRTQGLLAVRVRDFQVHQNLGLDRGLMKFPPLRVEIIDLFNPAALPQFGRGLDELLKHGPHLTSGDIFHPRQRSGNVSDHANFLSVDDLVVIGELLKPHVLVYLLSSREDERNAVASSRREDASQGISVKPGKGTKIRA
jgi:hypothetical protein